MKMFFWASGRETREQLEMERQEAHAANLADGERALRKLQGEGWMRLKEIRGRRRSWEK